MRAHSDAHHGDFGNVGVDPDALGMHGQQGFFDDAERLFVIGLGHGEGQIRRAIFAGILYDHVDNDVRVRDGAKNLRRQPGLIGNADQGDLHFILVTGHTGH